METSRGGDRLVRHDEFGTYRESPGHSDALPLPAAEFVREAVCHVGVEADVLQQFGHPLAVFRLAADKAVHDEGLPDDVARRHPRVQRAVGILENDLHFAAHGPHLLGSQFRQVLPLKLDLTVRGLVKLQDATASGGLAAAAFAHQIPGSRLSSP